jgi:DNA-binding response OmpR family regulator
MVLVKNAGKVLTHQQILNEVWGPSYKENAHYLRIYMSQLRQKLEADPTQPIIGDRIRCGISIENLVTNQHKL